MQCLKCHSDNPPDTRFCGQCGAPLVAACGACGAANPPENKFCGHCGSPLSGESKAEPVSPESYTPKHLAQKILTSRAALEGERKQVTVLFADVKGSMELLADRDPEEAHLLLDPVVERMMDAVHRYEGTVCEVRGDGIMALFGAPLAHEDHGMRACYSALDMQTAIRRYDEEVRRSHGVKAQIRVGINSGEVVVRAIGSDLRMDYAAVGESTHLAGRMEQLANPGDILLTANTLRIAEGFIEVKPLGPTPVKGLDAPVDVYELTGVKSARTRLQAAAARGLTGFVGRGNEIDHVRQALARAADGFGQIIGIVGEAGVGKSRLLWEVLHSDVSAGWHIVQSSSVSYGQATSYLPLMDLVKGYFKIEPGDSHDKIRETVTDGLLSLDRSLESAIPAFLSLLEVSFEDASWQVLDPPQRRQQMLEAARRLLLRESQNRPLLVVFEDLHWIDSETQLFLDQLVESVPASRLLLLVNYRPEYEHRWGGKTYYTQLRLDPLSSDNAVELLDSLVGGDPSLGPLKHLLIKRTEGNPFFLEESVRTLIETKDLVGARGAYRLARPTETIQMPATVQTVLAARIDRLPSEEKQLLETAAVIGKDVPLALLEFLYGQAELSLRQRLSHLQVTEFLYEAALFPEVEYTFKHALTHEVAYGTLLNEQRRGLHTRIVDAIEEVYGDRLAEHVERLALHSFRGQQWDRAVGFLRQAGEKAAARSAYHEAGAYIEQALVALGHLPESKESLRQGIDLRFNLRSALQALGEHERVFEHLRDAEKLASKLQDQDRIGWASAYLTQYLWRMGDPEQAEALGQRAHEIARPLGDASLEAIANFFLGQGYFNIGDYRGAIDYCRRNVDLLKGQQLYERHGLTGLPSVLSRVWLAWALAERGEFADAMSCATEALSIAEAAGQHYSIASACLCMGEVDVVKGANPEAIPILERAAELCKTWDLGVISPTVTAVLSLAYALCGKLADGLPALEQSEALAPEVRIFDTPTARTSLGAVYLLAGKLDRAAGVATRVADLSVRFGFRGCQAETSRILGDICARRETPDVDQAGEHYRRGLELANDLGMRPLVAHCHLGIGALSGRTEQRDMAREHLGTAIEMYRGMAMSSHLARAEEALGTFD